MKFDHAGLWTVLPMRGLIVGKSRLAPVLDDAGRAALNRDLLARTLSVLAEWDGALGRCIVVSPCMRALALARDAGARTLKEGASPVGLNRAVRLGASRAVMHDATQLLILPGDLPYVSAGALAEMESAAHGGERVVLAPDKAGTGTNALLIGAAAKFDFSFGAASLAAHQRAATRAGLTAVVVQRCELQFDLDTPEDLAAWQRTRTRSGSDSSHPRRKPRFPPSGGGVKIRRTRIFNEEKR